MTPDWHVVIDARAARLQMDGLGNYLREHVPRIVAARAFRCSLLVSPGMRSFWAQTAGEARLISSMSRPMWPAQHWEIPILLRGLRPDLFFYPAHDPPVLLRTPFVFTIHDLTPHLVRPYFERFDAAKRAYLRLVTAAAARRARAILAVSHATRDAIGAVFGNAAMDRTVVSLNGVPAAPPALARSERHFLYVGTDRPHKNLDRLIAAYARAASTVPTLPSLQLAGGMRRAKHLHDVVERHGVAGRVLLRGHVSAEELEELYAGAIALVMPSLAEGFGIPIVEAMSRGVPVITSRTSGCAEVAGDAAMLVDPNSVNAIADALVAMNAGRGTRRALADRGKARVLRFDWDRAAQVTLETLTQALSRSGR